MESPASASGVKQAAHYTQARQADPIVVERPFSGATGAILSQTRRPEAPRVLLLPIDDIDVHWALHLPARHCHPYALK